MIDRKLEPLIQRQMMKYLGELEDDDLVMFVLEHLKDHKGPHKLVEGLEPVRALLRHPYLTKGLYFLNFLLTSYCSLGSRRGSLRVRHQRMEANHLREHGLRRRSAHGEDDGRLKMKRLRCSALRMSSWTQPRTWSSGIDKDGGDASHAWGRYVCVVSICFPLRCTQVRSVAICLPIMLWGSQTFPCFLPARMPVVEERGRSEDVRSAGGWSRRFAL